MGGVRPAVPESSTLKVRSIVLFSNGEPLVSFGDSGVRGRDKVVGLACKCCDCDCVWDFFLEVHLSLLLFLVSVGLA